MSDTPRMTGGPADLQPVAASGEQASQSASYDLVDAVNNVFLAMKLSWPLYYQRAFPDAETLRLAKSLWLDKLSAYSPQRVTHALDLLIETSPYLPTLHHLLRMCDRLQDLLSPEQAWRAALTIDRGASHEQFHAAVVQGMEVCRLPLHSDEQGNKQAFKREYAALCLRVVIDGDELLMPPPPRIAIERQRS